MRSDGMWSLMSEKTYHARVMVEFYFDVKAEDEEQALEKACDEWADSNCVPCVGETQIWENKEEL